MQWDTDRLAELMAQKYQLLLSLQELVCGQKELVDRGEMAILLNLLATKQRVLDRLQSVERQLEPFRDQSPESRSWRNGQLRDQTAAYVESCQKLLADILQKEKHCEEQLLRHREEVAGQLRQLCSSGEMLAAYGAAQSRGHTQLDLISDG